MFVNLPPAFKTAASIAARAAGLTEIMYLPLAPRSIAEAGTVVIPIVKIIDATSKVTRKDLDLNLMTYP